MSTFGDFDPDDAWADEPPAPEQVTYRLHALRQYLSPEELADFNSLSSEEIAVSYALGERLTDLILSDPDHAPQEFHAVCAYLSDQPEWDQLSPEAQAVGVGLVDDILAWVRRQGGLG